MKIALQIVIGLILFCLLTIAGMYFYIKVFIGVGEEYRDIETRAVPTETHPLAGFYKSKGCRDDFGWAIAPANGKEYFVSFCGVGGCFKDTFIPTTTLFNDPLYEVVNENALRLREQDRQGEWIELVRCESRTSTHESGTSSELEYLSETIE